MEELAALCDQKLPITISQQWHGFNEAKQLLASKGYVVSPKDDDDDEEDEEFIPLDPQMQLHHEDNFPAEVPQPQYGKPRGERANADSTPTWTPCESLQVDTSKHKPEERYTMSARIPSDPIVEEMQKVAIQLLVQPYVKMDKSQFYVKLKIEKLMVGAIPEGLLKENKCLGFYPSFVKLNIEPEWESDVGDSGSVVLYLERGSEDGIMGSPSVATRTSDTTIGGQIGYGPILLKFQHTWGTQEEVSREKVKLVPVESIENGSLASFEWRIIKWKNGTRYRFNKPCKGLRLVDSPALPLERNAAKLEGFPDVMWKFPLNFAQAKMNLRMELQVKMDLVWFWGNICYRTLGSNTKSFTYSNIWALKHPCTTRQESPCHEKLTGVGS